MQGERPPSERQPSERQSRISNLKSAICNLQSHDPVVKLQIDPVAAFPAAVFETIFQ